ncbi:MAG: carbohydrate-binding family 9-like protein [Lentisphaerae bacterium]|nr:carbohydrate-binding family 9-like protein [Lentisphaerota bacterium]
MEYVIQRAARRPSLKGCWEEPAWQNAPTAQLRHFLAQSKSRHPKVAAKAVYQDDGIFVFFKVLDKYVRCVQTSYQASVCKDSCVEFFVEPKAGGGYFNFEINAGGTLLLHFNELRTARSGPAGFKRRLVPWQLGRQVEIYHSLPRTVNPEIKAATEWRVEYFIPFTIFEHYLGRLGPIPGQVWRGNFYKCADLTSRPHWLAWAPMGPELNFHLPKFFAPIKFRA